MQFSSGEKEAVVRGRASRIPPLFRGIGENQYRDLFPTFLYFWRRLREIPVTETMAFAVLAFSRLPLAIRLLKARHHDSEALIKVRPEVLEFLHAPYLATNWSVHERVDRIVDHCQTVNQIGGILNFAPDSVIDVLRLQLVDPQYRITLDQARWLIRDGQLVISLWHGADRLYSLAFCLSSQSSGLRAYVGGIQGRAGRDVLDRYRRFTKECHGMRPRDFLVEVFKLFCRAINVTEVYAVSNANRPWKPACERRRYAEQGQSDYDKIWIERGGLMGREGFFILPVVAYYRRLETVPARKRSMYRKRHEMMTFVNQQLTLALTAQQYRN